MATPEDPLPGLISGEFSPVPPAESTLVRATLSTATPNARPSSAPPNDLPGPLRLILRVGFAGTQKLPANSAPLLAALEKIFQTIAARLDEIAPGTPTPCVGPEPLVRHFYAKNNPVLRVVTGLCEGGDSLAAEALGKNFPTTSNVGGELAAVIPFPLGVYRDTRPDWFRKTFDEQAAKCAYILELDGNYEKPDPDTDRAKARRSRGYRGQSTLLLRQADLIVALANSKGAGRSGGTMETVRAALEFELPVVFVDAEIAAISLIEPDENFSSALDDLANTQAHWDTTLRDWVTRIVADPNAVTHGADRSAHKHNSGYENDLLTEFFTKNDVPPLAPADKGGVQVRQSFGGRCWSGFGKWFRSDSVVAKSSPSGAATEDEALPPYSLWRTRTRNLNQYYSDLYRGTFFLNYLLAAAAVCLAAMSLMSLTYHYHGQANRKVEPPSTEHAAALAGQIHDPKTEPPPASRAPATKPAITENAAVSAGRADASETKPPPVTSISKGGEAASPVPFTGDHLPTGKDSDQAAHGHASVFETGFFAFLLLLGLIKLFFVLRILLNTHNAYRKDYNDKAVDYRYVAERLRTMFYLPRIGSFQPPVAAPPQYDSRVVRQSASDWLLDAIVRHISPAEMPYKSRASFDFRHDNPASGQYEVTLLTPNPLKMLELTRDRWIELQRAYHDGAARSLARMNEWIEAWTKILNGAVIVIVLIDAGLLVGEIVGAHWAHQLDWLAPLFIFLTAILPAAVASLLGIRSQSECQRLSERSAVMRNILAGRPVPTPPRPYPRGLWAHVRCRWSWSIAFVRVCLPFLARPKPAPTVDPTGSKLEAVQKLIDKIKLPPPPNSHDDPKPGARVADALQVTESLADVFVREVVEWSVLYAKEVPEP